jgi:hypothetical protein
MESRLAAPKRVSRRSSTCGAGGARPHTQKRRLDRAHNAPVLAVHVDVRPPPAVSIEPPLFLYGSGGWGRKYLRGSQSVLRDTQATCELPGEIFLESYFLPDSQLFRIRLTVLFGPP